MNSFDLKDHGYYIWGEFLLLLHRSFNVVHFLSADFSSHLSLIYPVLLALLSNLSLNHRCNSLIPLPTRRFPRQIPLIPLLNIDIILYQQITEHRGIPFSRQLTRTTQSSDLWVRELRVVWLAGQRCEGSWDCSAHVFAMIA